MENNYKEIFEELGVNEQSLDIVFGAARIKCLRDISIITDLYRYSMPTKIARNTWDLVCLQDLIKKAAWESIGIPANLFKNFNAETTFNTLRWMQQKYPYGQ